MMHGKRCGSVVLQRVNRVFLNWKVCSPPTDESFFQNMKRSHLQIAVWRCSVNADPPTVYIDLYGWGNDGETKYLIPLLVAPDVCLVPEKKMKVFRCGCTSENSCKWGNCSCNNSRLPCSTFCECEGGINCLNLFNAKIRNKEDEEEHVGEE